jgi:uncharacterized protein YecT (DUF1311 family)
MHNIINKKIVIWLILFSMILFFESKAIADGPSFDCSKAITRVEKLICKSAELSTLDHRIEKVFREVRISIKINDSKQLRKNQYNWLKKRDKECGSIPNQSKALECLTAKYKKRMLFFEQMARSLDIGPGYNDEYIIIFSKDDAVCKYARDVLNKDLPINGFNPEPSINDPFQTVRWEEYHPQPDPKKNGYFHTVHFSKLDIDNNGIQDIVVFVRYPNNDYHDTAKNILYVTKHDLSHEQMTLPAIIRSSIGEIDSGPIYCLTECRGNQVCGKTYWEDFENLKKQSRERRGWCLGNAFSINPFIFKGTTYLMFKHWQKKAPRKWTIINKYKGGDTSRLDNHSWFSNEDGKKAEMLEDVCYLERVNK